MIAQPPQVVFAFFVPQRLPYWYGAEMQVEIELSDRSDEFTAGQKVRISGKLAGRLVCHTALITQCRWGETLEWRFQDDYGVRGTERWEFEPASAGGVEGTRLKMTSEYSVPGTLRRLADSIFTQPSLARRNREYLSRLKRYAERGLS